MKTKFKNLSFQRITSSGDFIPEIDGLRFIAIASVVIFHLNNFILDLDKHNYADSIDFSILTGLCARGHVGVPLFFIISGFILSLPFANYHLKQEKAISLKKYYLRRFTRLEPPYVILMSVYLIGAVFIAHEISLEDGLKSYGSSLIYSHNLIYPLGNFPILNPPAWSLEIEMQFYLLAPAICLIFRIKSSQLRRLLLALLIVILMVLNAYWSLGKVNVTEYLSYFLVGYLLADLYVFKSTILPKSAYDGIICWAFFAGIWILNAKDFTSTTNLMVWELIQLICMFLFYYYVLLHDCFRWLRRKFITSIGGMCYSIYLIHYGVLTFIGYPMLKHRFFDQQILNISTYALILLASIMAASVLFFLVIERPCMKPDWYRFGFKKFTNKS